MNASAGATHLTADAVRRARAVKPIWSCCKRSGQSQRAVDHTRTALCKSGENAPEDSPSSFAWGVSAKCRHEEECHRPPLRGFLKLCCVARRTRKRTTATKSSRLKTALRTISNHAYWVAAWCLKKQVESTSKPNFRKLSFFVSTRQATWLVSTTLRSKLLENFGFTMRTHT